MLYKKIVTLLYDYNNNNTITSYKINIDLSILCLYPVFVLITDFETKLN